MTDAWGTGRANDDTAIPGWSADATTNVAGGDAAGNEPEVEVIVAEIEQTRGEMSETVAAIGEKLDPANIVQGAKDATVGKVEQTVRNVQNAAEEFVAQPVTTVQQAGGGLVETIRANPVPAALAGIGIGWLWMSRSGSNRGGGRFSDRYRYDRAGWAGAYPAAGGGGYQATGYGAAYGDAWTGRGSVPSGSQGIGSRVGDSARDLGQTVGQTAGAVTDTVGQTAGAVTDTVGQTVGQVGQTVGQVGQTVGDTVGQVPMQARGVARQVGDTVSQNPLGFGVVALAVGTAIGLALPATSTERRVLGQASTRLIDEAESKASEGMEQIRSSAEQQS